MSRLLQAVAAYALARPDAVAVSDDRRALTYAELQAAVEAATEPLAEALAPLPPQAPVAIELDNGCAWVVADLALIALGRASLPLPPFFSPAQRAHALADAGACAVLRPSADAFAVELLDQAPRPLHPGTAKITYTSGSTGQPKGVCLSLEQLEATAAGLVEALGAEFAGRHLAVLPLSVLLENVAGLYATLLAGGEHVCASAAALGMAEPFRPDFRRLAAAVAEAEATSLILVPELLRGLCADLAVTGRRLPSLKLVAVGGAKVSPHLIAQARALGVPAYEGYGLSECGSVVALNTPAADRPGTVGRVLPHHQLTLADDGELIVGGRPFLGYVGGPAQSGPLATGDLGRIDADGFVSIAGRKSNLLITGFGRNVAPEWVESELLAQPEIGQALVFGEAAPGLCALVVPSARSIAAEALKAAVERANQSLPDYARVRRWRLSPPFDPGAGELTANGRPRRGVIRRNRERLELPTEA